MKKYSKILSYLGICAALALAIYMAKSRLGIDLDPGHHARHYFSSPFSVITLAQAQIIDSSVKPVKVPLKAHIIVDVRQDLGAVNHNVLGLNILGIQSSWKPDNPYSDFGGGLWDPQHKTWFSEPVELARAIHVRTLRFPGGNGTQSYDWKRTIDEHRSEFRFGVDEFMRMAHALDAQPVFTLSYFTGGPSDAADLVEYLNSPADSDHPWALKRAAKGSIEPYGVRYFEFGNEVDNHKDIKTVYPQQYALDYLHYYEAMKKVDPKVQLGVGLYYESWNQEVLKIIGDKIDFGVMHIYPTPSWGKELETMPAEEIFAVSLAIPGVQVDHELKMLREQLRQASGRDVPVFVTEYNGGFQQEKPVAYRHSLGNALVNAELIRVLMDPANNVAMAHHWNFINEYWGMIANRFSGDAKDLTKPYYKRPNFYVFDLYSHHFGDELLPVRIVSPGYDAGQYDFYKEMIRNDPGGKLEGPQLLGFEWDIFSVEGIKTAQEGDALMVQFGQHKQWNYFHCFKYAHVEPNTFYRLSGYVRTEDLNDNSGGVNLEVQDARGWVRTRSAAGTARLKGNASWTYVETYYHTLPDTKKVKVFARRSGDRGPLTGKAFFKDVQLQKFVPEIDAQVAYLSVNASRSMDGGRVYLIVVNKNLESTETATIELNGFLSSGIGKSWTLNGSDIDSSNELQHDSVRITGRNFNVSGNSFEYMFEQHSLTAIELEKM